MYAHRNEDIVNFGPVTQGKLEGSTREKGLRHPHMPLSRGTKPDNIDGKENDSSSSKNRKRIQYSLVARFAGMEEVEFSKWLLSATPLEREKVLRDYKKRKEKLPNG